MEDGETPGVVGNCSDNLVGISIKSALYPPIAGIMSCERPSQIELLRWGEKTIMQILHNFQVD